MRQTKIMATLANNRATTNFIASLRQQGMDSVRINSAHVDPATIVAMVGMIRKVDPAIAILMDTKGPEIRTTSLVQPLQLNAGDNIRLDSARGDEPSSREIIHVAVGELHKYVSSGQMILIDDGAIAAEVTGIEGEIIRARVSRGGVLDSRKTVAIEGAEIPPLPAVSERDKINIRAAVSVGIDMIAHSFVRWVEDVNAVRELLKGTSIKLFAKIECRQAMENIEEILNASDGLLVARGDLGTAIPLHEIPAAQYDIIRHCREAGKPSIVATQILNSMISNPVPTRAEVSDIALSIMEGADILLLCGETAMGEYPAECVGVMRQTIESIEKNSLRCKIN